MTVLGCYINPVILDEKLWKAETDRFIEPLGYAKRMNAHMVGTETGRFSLDMSVTPLTESEDCYRLLLDSFSRIVDAAECEFFREKYREAAESITENKE